MRERLRIGRERRTVWAAVAASVLNLGITLALVGLPATATAAPAHPDDDRAMGDGLRDYELAAALRAGEVEAAGQSSPDELATEIDPSAASVCASGGTVKGIDISKWQGNVNWTSVANDGVEFAFVRVSHGLNTFDQFFDANWSKARAAGLRVGVYQYFEPGQNAEAQADLLLEHMGPLQPGDLPPVIDVESHGGLSSTAVAAAVTKWVNRVEAATGVKPIIYTGRFFWQDYVKSSAFADYPLWIAHYTNGCPNLPSQWSEWTFHQYTDSGSTAGVNGNTDTNRFNGDLEALLAWGGNGDSCGDGTCGGSEDSSTCAADCPSCGLIAADGGTIDDGDACYVFHGPSQWWRKVQGGQGGDSVWTGTTKTTVTNYAEVLFDFAEAGTYRVEANVPTPNNTSKQAKYKLQHAGGLATVVMNQSTKNGWVSLGTFNFDGGSGGSLTLADATGESNSLGRRVVFDAIRLTRIDEQAAGVDPDANDGIGGGDVWGRGVEGEQSCAVDPGARFGSPAWALLVLGAWAARRRVRR
ncbi:MAG: hypothetical protein IPH07_35035 [Deltaproteobacteria bacterium]|nr:hypothetical protein [Deltaproteobacteria bacterium]MBK8235397.1 hypothetical protein [Deltaproteobacteria bacterium]MBK8716284.1 hypothetical protein [Deltaproteobacteria bacterium]MBP7291332.1 hypothetical protein [Nannocystaceae bacterium]